MPECWPDWVNFWCVIGFIFIRIFWTALVVHYTRYELRIARLYMILLSLTFVAALIFIAGATFGQALAVLLYTPLLEIIVSSVVFRVQDTRKKRHQLLRPDSVRTDVE